MCLLLEFFSGLFSPNYDVAVLFYHTNYIVLHHFIYYIKIPSKPVCFLRERKGADLYGIGEGETKRGRRRGNSNQEKKI